MKKLFLLLMLPLVAFGVSGCTEKEPEVKNIIIMIGDGMGLAQASLTQIENKYAPTAFDRAQNVALQKTYSANNRVCHLLLKISYYSYLNSWLNVASWFSK